MRNRLRFAVVCLNEACVAVIKKFHIEPCIMWGDCSTHPLSKPVGPRA